ncbi:MAG: hypothetical protein PVJ50_06620 [Desulfobacterales bacterium]|jgi:hypothetical protein
MIKAKGNNYEVEQWGRKVKKAEAGQTRKLPQIGFVKRTQSADRYAPVRTLSAPCKNEKAIIS